MKDKNKSLINIITVLSLLLVLVLSTFALYFYHQDKPSLEPDITPDDNTY